MANKRGSVFLFYFNSITHGQRDVITLCMYRLQEVKSLCLVYQLAIGHTLHYQICV
jgi:hypothetical protein